MKKAKNETIKAAESIAVINVLAHATNEPKHPLS
jgi:hypothetical protein